MIPLPITEPVIREAATRHGDDDDAPNEAAISHALAVAAVLNERGLAPSKILATAEGGLAFTFSGEGQYAHLECWNAGSVTAYTRRENAAGDVWLVGDDETEAAVRCIAAFVGATS